MDIAINDKTGQMTLAELKQIEDLLNFSAGYLDVSIDSEMSVTFMDNMDIQTINRNYRGKDAPTDVISFAMEEKGEGEPAIFLDEEMDALPRNLGDIMISIEKAKEQAKAYGHSYKREIVFLVIHGFLHINGYDHQTSEEEKEMSKLQKEILDAYGLRRE